MPSTNRNAWFTPYANHGMNRLTGSAGSGRLANNKSFMSDIIFGVLAVTPRWSWPQPSRRRCTGRPRTPSSSSTPPGVNTVRLVKSCYCFSCFYCYFSSANFLRESFPLNTWTQHVEGSILLLMNVASKPCKNWVYTTIIYVSMFTVEHLFPQNGIHQILPKIHE